MCIRDSPLTAREVPLSPHLFEPRVLNIARRMPAAVRETDRGLEAEPAGTDYGPPSRLDSAREAPAVEETVSEADEGSPARSPRQSLAVEASVQYDGEERDGVAIHEVYMVAMLLAMTLEER